MTFRKQCFCKKTNETFRTDFKDTNALSLVFCPDCVEQSGEDTLLVSITGVPGRSGVWGLKFNREILAKEDNSYKETNDYYVDVFDSQKCVFDFIPQRTPRMFYRIVEVKQGAEKKSYSGLSGNDFEPVKDEGSKLPGKTQSGNKESYKKKEGS